MQINQNEIQRPTLITPFFGKELTPDNEYLSYIDTSSDCISVTPTSNNSKNQLLFEDSCRAFTLQPDARFFHNDINGYFISIGFSTEKTYIDHIHDVVTDYFSTRKFSILDPQSHNCIQSLM